MPSTPSHASTPVREVMTTDVLTFSPEESVESAMARLVERGVSGGPVLDEGRRVIGMLTDSDLIVQEVELHAPTVISLFGGVIELPSSRRHLEEDLRKALGSTVRDVMARDVVTCGPDDTVEHAATLLHDRDVSRLAVVDGDGRLLGVLARGDVLRFLVRRGG